MHVELWLFLVSKLSTVLKGLGDDDDDDDVDDDDDGDDDALFFLTAQVYLLATVTGKYSKEKTLHRFIKNRQLHQANVEATATEIVHPMQTQGD